MNAPSHPESTALAVADPTFAVGAPMDAASLILGPAFDRVQTFAKLMSAGAVSVPKHLRGNMGDCMAITIQALGWRMNPFAVAQKTHLSQSGALGYEAQLVSAVLVSTGAIKKEPEYEAVGDWAKVLGKVEERQGKARPDGTEGGKWFAATYTKKDEEGLGVIVRATLSGESAPRELRVMMSQAYPRFSTQWATDPFQQLCYLAVRKWGRLNSPGAILGVYTPEELDGGSPTEKHMGPADVVQPASAPTHYPDADFKKNLPAWTDVMTKGRKTADQIITMAETKHPLTEEQKAQVRKAAPAGKPADAPQDVVPKVTYAILADRVNNAADRDAGAVILDEGRALPADQQADLQKLFDDKFPAA